MRPWVQLSALQKVGERKGETQVKNERMKKIYSMQTASISKLI
jgi:hypothetical protein